MIWWIRINRERGLKPVLLRVNVGVCVVAPIRFSKVKLMDPTSENCSQENCGQG